jgi:hypothetical protein
MVNMTLDTNIDGDGPDASLTVSVDVGIDGSYRPPMTSIRIINHAEASYSVLKRLYTVSDACGGHWGSVWPSIPTSTETAQMRLRPSPSMLVSMGRIDHQ